MSAQLVVYAHAAPAQKLRLWVGVRDAATAPGLSFTLNGAAVNATALRPMTPTRAAPCSFTGIYELSGLSPDTRYVVRVTTDIGVSQELHSRTLPTQLAMGDTFRVLLVSCYHRDEDTGALLRSLEGAIPWDSRPNLVLLAGDQVYLDLPTQRNFPSDVASLAKIFEANYVANWFESSLTSVLGMAPIICAPDDHEYWNNYPDRAVVVQNTWSEAGRAGWQQAAKTMYSAFQLPAGTAIGGAIQLDVPPLSFYVLDTRSTRQAGGQRLVEPAAMAAFQQWAAGLTPDRIGVLVTGQSLLATPVSKTKGFIADWELANYAADYATIVRAVHAAARRASGFLLLTGDVHWGRVTTVGDSDGVLLHEVISSPTALVTTLVRDSFRSLFGRITRDPWPRHAAGDTAPEYFARSVIDRPYATKVVHPQKGDQAALLEFTRAGASCTVNITYHMLSSSPTNHRPIKLDFRRS